MDAKELQEEELEVLASIYDGDTCFNQVNETTFQYKVGADGDNRSFLVEIVWGETYPEDLPTVNLNTFYNKHLNEGVKTTIATKLLEEGEPFIGAAMTYSLFEYAKENADELTLEQTQTVLQTTENKNDEDISEANLENGSKKPKERKEQLTKAQKRRMFDRFGNQGERPRGWDWVDIVKHLSQTGSQPITDKS